MSVLHHSVKVESTILKCLRLFTSNCLCEFGKKKKLRIYKIEYELNYAQIFF